MEHKSRDPLLLAGKVIAIFLQGAMAVGAVILALLIPAMFLFEDRITVEIAHELGDPALSLPLLAIAGVMLIGLAMLALMFVFFGNLRRIIATVGEGDPFQPANADRLSRMGWLMLAVQLLMLPAAAFAMRLAEVADKVEGTHVSIDGGLDVTGILLVIILFILARVFRHGAAMREDLEGTV